MNCREIKQFSSDYLDRRLTPAEAASFEEHLRACGACTQEVDFLRETVSLVGSLGEIETSPDFLAHVHRKIEKTAKFRSLRHWLFEPMRLKLSLEITALALLGIGALHLYYQSPDLYREADAPAPSMVLQDKGAEPAAPKELGERKAEMEQTPGAPAPSETPRAERKISREGGEASQDRETLRDRPKEEEVVGKIARNDGKDQIHEVRVEDISASEQTVRKLVAEAGGKVVAEAPSSGRGLWLTVEVPQSRRAQFVSALKDQGKSDSTAARSRLKSAPEGRAAQEKTIETDALTAKQAAPASKPSAPTEEPKVTLRIHIIPKE